MVFFMNWFGNQAGEGFEYHLLVIGLALSALLQGGGKYAVDGKMQFL
jgi:putative oxidoreductase